jgi:hypothetical protein
LRELTSGYAMHHSSAMRLSTITLSVTAGALALGPVAPAGAAVRATTKLVEVNSGARLTVKLARKGELTPAQQPRAVRVKGGGRTYKLRKPRARNGLGTWRSAVYRGAAAKRLRALAGSRVRVLVRSRSGSQTLRTRVRGGPSEGGGGTDDVPQRTDLFERPSGELSGDAAFAHIQRYFVNSRFTDCPPGGPACSTEERYNHCAGGGRTGKQEHHRLTPISGSDINSSGTYTVTGAAAHPDGSWGVQYVLDASGNRTFYSWSVAANGSVTGTYTGPNGEQQALGPLQWQQPSGC